MKFNTIFYLLIALLGLTVSASIAQQNQNVLKTDTEVEKLKKRVSELEGKLKTVETVEKMELKAKLAEAEEKLLNAEIDKYKRGLKDENDEWLRTWSLWFVGIIGFFVLFVGGSFWYWLRSRSDQLIVNEIEKRINKFQEAVVRVDSLDEQISILEIKHALSVLQDYPVGILTELDRHPDRIKTLSDEVLLDAFSEKTPDLQTKWVISDILVARGTTEFVSPVLKFLNSIIDGDIDLFSNVNFSYDPRYHLSGLVCFVGIIPTEESYSGLKSILNRLLTENSEYKDLLVEWTAYSLAMVSVALNRKDSINVLIKSIPEWNFLSSEQEAIEETVNNFNLLNKQEVIKEIYNTHIKGKFHELEDTCLDLLQEKFQDWVRERREEKAANNTEGEETDESEPAS